jgi:hypothetical protein
MKSLSIIKKVAVLLTFIFSLLTLFAQNDTMYIMKNGAVVAQYNVNTEVDSIIFYKPTIVVDELKVQTNYPENRTDTTIVLSGTIISNTAGDIIEKGFVYGTTPDPTFADSKIVSDTEEDTFFATISGITLETDFYVRAYAINATDTVYGSNMFTGPVALKPNIYIYPTEKMQLSVNLSFPLGGNILTSIPDYNTGWNVTVEPSGEIDNIYTYLFYESSQPAVWQTESGWQVKQAELTRFFTSNLVSYGFSEQEIIDFIDYWIPLFKDKEYYTIYPQTNVEIDQVISINFSTPPDKIMRLFYLVKGFDNKPIIELEEPVIPTFEPTGFYVTEWGVLL